MRRSQAEKILASEDFVSASLLVSIDVELLLHDGIFPSYCSSRHVDTFLDFSDAESGSCLISRHSQCFNSAPIDHMVNCTDASKVRIATLSNELDVVFGTWLIG